MTIPVLVGVIVWLYLCGFIATYVHLRKEPGMKWPLLVTIPWPTATTAAVITGLFIRFTRREKFERSLFLMLTLIGTCLTIGATVAALIASVATIERAILWFI